MTSQGESLQACEVNNGYYEENQMKPDISLTCAYACRIDLIKFLKYNTTFDYSKVYIFMNSFLFKFPFQST